MEGVKEGSDGMVGNEGIFVGMVGTGVTGSGGGVTLGAAGMVGRVGFGKEGIWMLGSGGIVVLGRDGMGLIVNGGNVGFGREGREGTATLGRDGIVGTGNAVACRRFRAAKLVSMLDKHNAATIKDNRKQRLKLAILVDRDEIELIYSCS
ncbi:hypothetical protein RchiOBHm_Chr2g0111361 [Rosa chinensis]|uniref:Uncharacterized protein n=1 Tax=Rosa chinensis TaxID=74649 RepID=A0A2P6RPY0_ROSCH|nr:hypothetical protein RchiOBHm_Chr2g0111361 [Rosa chinensis]